MIQTSTRLLAAIVTVITFNRADASDARCTEPILSIPNLRTIATVTEAIQGKNCEVFLPSGVQKSQLNGVNDLNSALSPFWAQELIGADLAKAFLETQRQNTTIGIAVVDDSFDPTLLSGIPIAPSAQASLETSHRKDCPSDSNGRPCGSHGISVISQMVDPIVGNSKNGVISTFMDAGFGGAVVGRLRSALSNENTRLINLSQRTSNVPAELKTLVRDSGKIVVQCMGNEYPRAGEVLGESITVGSLSPLGTLSSFSGFDGNTDIVAPSDYFLLSRNKNSSEFAQFGGTSGAAPLVTGALADTLSLIPGLTRDEARLLLKRTSLKNDFFRSVNSDTGILNQYKLIRVAQRLQEMKFDNLRPEERQRILRSESTYRFAAKSEEEIKSLETNVQANITSDPCRAKTALNSLREEALLNQNPAALRSLVKIYEQAGMKLNAILYSSLLEGEFRNSLTRGMALVRSIHDNSRSTPAKDYEGVLSLGLSIARATRAIRDPEPSYLLGLFELNLHTRLSPSGGQLSGSYLAHELLKIEDRKFQLELRRSALSKMQRGDYMAPEYIRGLAELGPDAVPLLKLAKQKKLDSIDMGETMKVEARSFFQQGLISRAEFEELVTPSD